MIQLNNISYSYPAPSGGTAALRSVTETIKSGIITAIIGPAGSGKSTLIEIIGGIIPPDTGTVTIDGMPPKQKNIGMVFQYPEYQLFADTVYDDIAYGPKNLGLLGSELEERVMYAAECTGLTRAQLKLSPFELSGGQKRMAAIAGVIAMDPAILLLDEPAAGLDPLGRRRIFALIKAMPALRPDMSIIFVTHSMNDAAEYAGDMLLLKDGAVRAHGAPREVFSDNTLTEVCGFCAPEALQLAAELKSRGIDIGMPLTAGEAFKAFTDLIKGGGKHAS